MNNIVKKYLQLKLNIFNILKISSEKSLVGIVFDWFIMTLIVVNVVFIIIDTFEGVPQYVKETSDYVEFFSLIIFTIEYALRLWTADILNPSIRPLKARKKYMFSFMAIIDLLAIIPSYIPLILTIDLSILRALRLLRLLRMLKFNRYTTALSRIGNVVKNRAPQLISSMIVLFILMIISSLLMYHAENEIQPDVFKNAFSGIWWTTSSITNLGYGDIFPVTTLGKILSIIVALFGISLIAVPTGIIAAGFSEDVITERKEASKEQKHFCPYCGKNLDE